MSAQDSFRTCRGFDVSTKNNYHEPSSSVLKYYLTTSFPLCNLVAAVTAGSTTTQGAAKLILFCGDSTKECVKQ